MLTDPEIQFLKELNENKVPFLIVGMMAAVLQDVPLVTRDVDLWFQNTEDPKLVQAAKSCGAVFMPANMIFQMPPRIGGEAFKNFDVVYGIVGLDSFEEEYKNAIDMEISGVPVKVLPLEKVIASKMATGREKDKAALPILNTVLLDKKNNPS